MIWATTIFLTDCYKHDFYHKIEIAIGVGGV